jgi:hypothetical protein
VIEGSGVDLIEGSGINFIEPPVVRSTRVCTGAVHGVRLAQVNGDDHRPCHSGNRQALEVKAMHTALLWEY